MPYLLFYKETHEKKTKKQIMSNSKGVKSNIIILLQIMKQVFL